MHVVRAGLVRRALADHGAAADQRRPVGGRRRAHRAIHGLRIVAVDGADHVPAVGLEALRRVVAEPAGDVAVDRDTVVVVEHDQLAKTERPGERAGLVRHALHQAAVADEHERAVIDDRVALAVEARGQELLGERHADRVGEALAERARRGLDAGREPHLGVSRRLRVQLAEALQFADRQVVAGQVQQCVEQHRAVAVRQHEAVAVRPRRIARVVAQVPAPHDLGDFRHAERHAGVSGLGRLDGIGGEHAERVRELGRRDVRRRELGRGGHGVGAGPGGVGERVVRRGRWREGRLPRGA